MAYLRTTLATWDIDVDGPEARALIEKIRTDGAAVFRRQPGFVRYRLMRLDARRTVAVAEWESEEVGARGALAFRDWLAEAGIRPHIEMETRAGEIIVATDAEA